jgi:hypothetical protein
VCAGTVAEVMGYAASHTGKALREYEGAFAPHPNPLPARGERGPESSRQATWRMGH